MGVAGGRGLDAQWFDGFVNPLNEQEGSVHFVATSLIYFLCACAGLCTSTGANTIHPIYAPY